MASGGRVHFILITDIARSSFLWETFPKHYAALLEKHNTLLIDIIHRFEGEVMKNMGDGYIALFGSAHAAVAAAVAIQRALAMGPTHWPPFPDGKELTLRVIVHGGTLQKLGSGRGWFGPPLNRASRMCSACHPGQALLSGYVQERLVELPEEAALTNLGEYRLRDMGEPEEIFQLSHPLFKQQSFPPLKVDDDRPDKLKPPLLTDAQPPPAVAVPQPVQPQPAPPPPAAAPAASPPLAGGVSPAPVQSGWVPPVHQPRPTPATQIIIALLLLLCGIVAAGVYFQQGALREAAAQAARDRQQAAGGSGPADTPFTAGDTGEHLPAGGKSAPLPDKSDNSPKVQSHDGAALPAGDDSDNTGRVPTQPPAAEPPPAKASPRIHIDGYNAPGNVWILGTNPGTELARFGKVDSPVAGMEAFAHYGRTVQFNRKDVSATVGVLLNGNLLAAVLIEVPASERSYSDMRGYYQTRYAVSEATFNSPISIQWLDTGGRFLALYKMHSSTVILYGTASLPWTPGETLPEWTAVFID